MSRADDPLAEHDPWIGRVLKDRYRVERRLGEGGFGAAYRAVDLEFERTTRSVRHVVAKIPHAGREGTGGLPKDFLKEATELTRLQHAHIIKVTDIGAYDGVPFLVLDYAAGGSLADRLRGRARSQTVTEVLGWLPDVARALDYIASHQVLHRDVKPGNILFDAGGSALLADFGIVKVFGDSSTTGALSGTPHYMAPDAMLVREGGDLDRRYDEYALAVTVYEALSAHFPIESGGGDDMMGMRILFRKANEDPSPVRRHAPEVSPNVEAVLAKALARRRENRYPTCTEFADAFRDAVHAPVLPPTVRDEMPAHWPPAEILGPARVIEPSAAKRTPSRKVATRPAPGTIAVSPLRKRRFRDRALLYGGLTLVVLVLPQILRLEWLEEQRFGVLHGLALGVAQTAVVRPLGWGRKMVMGASWVLGIWLDRLSSGSPRLFVDSRIGPGEEWRLLFAERDAIIYSLAVQAFVVARPWLQRLRWVLIAGAGVWLLWWLARIRIPGFAPFWHSAWPARDLALATLCAFALYDRRRFPDRTIWD